MSDNLPVSLEIVSSENGQRLAALKADYEALGMHLERRGMAIETLKNRVRDFGVAIPSWGVGTGGTRFARFAGIGEPRDIYEKLDDCALIHQLTGATPTVSLHIPWDKVDDPSGLRDYGRALGLGFDAMSSNTFQDQPDQSLSYKFGSLTHTDKATEGSGHRAQYIVH